MSKRRLQLPESTGINPGRALRQKYERDLKAKEVASLTGALVEIAFMYTLLVRQDSIMISSNDKKMSLLKLIYAINVNSN